MFAAPEQDVVPDTLQPFDSQAFLSSHESLPDGDGHWSQELPEPHRKQSSLPLLASVTISMVMAKVRTSNKAKIFFIQPPLKILLQASMKQYRFR
jgi:hypothetical protein